MASTTSAGVDLNQVQPLAAFTVAVSCVPVEQLVSEGLRSGSRLHGTGWGASDHTGDSMTGLAQSLFAPSAPPGLPLMASSDVLATTGGAAAGVHNRSFDDVHRLKNRLMASSTGSRDGGGLNASLAQCLDAVLGSHQVDIAVPDEQDSYRVHLLLLVDPRQGSSTTSSSHHNQSASHTISTLSSEPKPQQVAQVTVRWTQFQQLVRFVMSVAPKFAPPSTPRGLAFPVDAAVSFVQNTSFLRRPEVRADGNGGGILTDGGHGGAGAFSGLGDADGSSGDGADSQTRELRRTYMESYLNAATQNSSTSCLKEVQSFVGYRMYAQNQRDLLRYHAATGAAPAAMNAPTMTPAVVASPTSAETAPSAKARRTAHARVPHHHDGSLGSRSEREDDSRTSSLSGGASLHSAAHHGSPDSSQSSPSSSHASSLPAISEHSANDTYAAAEGDGKRKPRSARHHAHAADDKHDGGRSLKERVAPLVSASVREEQRSRKPRSHRHEGSAGDQPDGGTDRHRRRHRRSARARPAPAPLTDADKAMLEECFRMIDIGENGSIELVDTATFLGCATKDTFTAHLRVLYHRAELNQPDAAGTDDGEDGEADGVPDPTTTPHDDLTLPQWIRDVTRIDLLPHVPLYPSTFIAMVEQLLVAAAYRHRGEHGNDTPASAYSSSSWSSYVASSRGSSNAARADRKQRATALSQDGSHHTHRVHHRHAEAPDDAPPYPPRTMMMDPAAMSATAATMTTIATLSEDNVEKLRQAHSDDVTPCIVPPQRPAGDHNDAAAKEPEAARPEPLSPSDDAAVVLSEWVDAFWMLHYHSLYLSLGTLVSGQAGEPLRDALNELHTRTLRDLVMARARRATTLTRPVTTMAPPSLSPEAAVEALGGATPGHAFTRTTSATVSSDDVFSSVSHHAHPISGEGFRHLLPHDATGGPVHEDITEEELYVIDTAVRCAGEVVSSHPTLFGYRTLDVLALAYVLTETGLRTVSTEEVLEWLVVQRATSHVAFAVEEFSSLMDTLSRAIPFSAILRCLTPSPTVGAGATGADPDAARTAAAVAASPSVPRVHCDSGLLRLVSRGALGADPQVCESLAALVAQRGKALRGGHCAWCDRVLALLHAEEAQLTEQRTAEEEALRERDELRHECAQREEDLSRTRDELASVKTLLREAELRHIELLEALEEAHKSSDETASESACEGGTGADDVAAAAAAHPEQAAHTPAPALPPAAVDGPPGALRLTPLRAGHSAAPAPPADRVVSPGALLYVVPAVAHVRSACQSAVVDVAPSLPTCVQLDFFLCHAAAEEPSAGQAPRRVKERLSFRDVHGLRCLELIIEDRKLRVVGATPSQVDTHASSSTDVRLEGSTRQGASLALSTHSASGTVPPPFHRRSTLRGDSAHTDRNASVHTRGAVQRGADDDFTGPGTPPPDARRRAVTGAGDDGFAEGHRNDNLLYPYRSLSTRRGVSQLDRLRHRRTPTTRTCGARADRRGSSEAQDDSDDDDSGGDDDDDGSGSSDSLLGESAVQRKECTMVLHERCWHRLRAEVNWERQEVAVSLNTRLEGRATGGRPLTEGAEEGPARSITFAEPPARLDKTQRTKLLMTDAGLVSGLQSIDVYPRRTIQVAYCNVFLIYE